MKAIAVRDRNAGIGGLSLTEMPYPHAGQNEVIVQVYAGGFTPGELDWPTTWTDRRTRPDAERARPPCSTSSWTRCQVGVHSHAD